MANPKLFRTIDRAVFDYKMIEENDRILLAASGGKDSTALAEYFSMRIKRPNPKFTVHAMHIASDVAPEFSSEIIKRFDEWNIPLTVKKISVLGRLKPGEKMNCWWCSSQRRTELNKFAMENGFNKIALGHHIDDILETLLMNSLQKGILATMPPVLKFDKYPVTIIRPLCLADLSMIIRHAEEAGYICSTCTCTFQENSVRKTARSRLAGLTGGSYKLKINLFNSLKNILPKYLP
ncbi:tRNA 2-thiocytidine biosynthesis TtcA family protein [Treponema pedis]|uniref:tRNA 2-thiocytidine biosynthesis protein TtcA n=1 Tax=Treponema pedis TaxID=409322 RepID=A0A7S7AXA9_9SPIR|nr:tRNA 2-thiocytidine biosynthesis TtcA family protein [Treponema pedis]QOW60946.1 tRNA 2-thiocytidine biosynthesis protein TtcA [Treponema pedis]QSI04209.1 tRNA 2-thiocytidine biosynthesis protein TtcA [Treponema pedis]